MARPPDRPRATRIHLPDRSLHHPIPHAGGYRRRRQPARLVDRGKRPRRNQERPLRKHPVGIGSGAIAPNGELPLLVSTQTVSSAVPKNESLVLQHSGRDPTGVTSKSTKFSDVASCPACSRNKWRSTLEIGSNQERPVRKFQDETRTVRELARQHGYSSVLPERAVPGPICIQTDHVPTRSNA